MIPFDACEFRKALGSFVTGVTVVTTVEPDGGPRGFTANSFTSVSLDPPLVLICIAKTAASCPVFEGSGHFAVNVLAEHQQAVSGLFASKSPDKFAATAWSTGPAGSPLIAGAAAWFDCTTHQVVDAGDHLVLIGRVAGFGQSPATPLAYCRGAYVAFGLSQEALAAADRRTRVGAILERDGAVLLLADAEGRLDLPAGAGLDPAADPRSLKGVLARHGLDARLSFLFAVFEEAGADRGTVSIYYRGTLDGDLPGDPALRLVPLDDIPWSRLADDAVRSMLQRFVKERGEDSFGIYVGDAAAGTVRALAPAAALQNEAGLR